MKFAIGERVIVSDEYPDPRLWGKGGVIVSSHRLGPDVNPDYGTVLYSVLVTGYASPFRLFEFEMTKDAPAADGGRE